MNDIKPMLIQEYPIDRSPSLTPRSKEAIAAVTDLAISLVILMPSPYKDEFARSISDFGSFVQGQYSLSSAKTNDMLKALNKELVNSLRQNGMLDLLLQAGFTNISELSRILIVWQKVISGLHSSGLINPEDGLHYQRAVQILFLVTSLNRVAMYSLSRRGKRKSDAMSRLAEVVNLSSITAGSASDVSQMFETLLPIALYKLGITQTKFRDTYLDETKSFQPYVVTSAGPNGQAMWTGYKDASAVLRYTPLASAIDRFGKIHTVGSVKKVIDSLRLAAVKAKQYYPLDEISSFCTGRLHAINELGCKVRIVAIVDYWSQMLLSPLHNTLAKLVSQLDMDGTFDQNKLASRVKEWSGDQVTEIYSFDLSNATDRLPRWLQVALLSTLHSPEFGSVWGELIANRRFALPPELHSKHGAYVKYAVGQPMGAKSSFPMLAITHHAIVQMAHFLVTGSMEMFTDYVILGDDNTLTNKLVADKYLALMDMLGVDINLSKSYVHQPGCASVGEICKRVFIEGLELSAINAKLLAKVYYQPKLIGELQADLAMRGSPIIPSVWFDFVSAYGTKALKFSAFLNSFPTKVSGFKERILPYFLGEGNYRVEDTFGISTSDVIECFSFVTIKSQLERLDAILKGSMAIQHAMANIRDKDLGLIRPLGSVSSTAQRQLMDSLPGLSDPHPLALAAASERARLMKEIQSILRDPATAVKLVRTGQLDLFRNTLSSVWTDAGTRFSPKVGDRILLDNTIKSLFRVLKSKETKLTFEVFTTMFGMWWTVMWTSGLPTYVTFKRHRLPRVSGYLRKLMRRMFKHTPLRFPIYAAYLNM